MARKIRTLDGAGLWRNAYAHQRAGMLRAAGVPEEDVAGMINSGYVDLPADVRCGIETRGAGE